MDNELTYDLFSELNITIPIGAIECIKTFIENTNKDNTWLWPTTTLPNTYIINTELRTIDFGTYINEFINDFRATLSILKVPPNSNVPWHIDVNPTRRCVINTPLTEYPKSLTFVTSAPVPDTNLCKDTTYHTFKIPYLINKVYLLNSQRYHSVFNFDNNIRYVTSFCSEFLNYQEACNYFKDKKIINRQW
jgi:hypothetical protein